MKISNKNIPIATKRKYTKKNSEVIENRNAEKSLQPIQLKFAPDTISTMNPTTKPKSTIPNNKQDPDDFSEKQATKKHKSSNSSTISNTTISDTSKNRLTQTTKVTQLGQNNQISDITLDSTNTQNTNFNTLFAFGLSPDTSPSAKPNINFGRTPTYTTRLRAAIIATETGTSIVFRVEAINPTSSTWMGKILRDEVEKEVPWTQSLNFSTQIYYWYHNDVVQYNEKKYKIGLVHMRIKGTLPSDTAVKIGKHICSHLNKIENNRNKITVIDNNYFWLPDGAVWSDLIGNELSYNTIVNERGIPHEGENYYEKNRTLINTHFRAGFLPPMIAKRFGIPSNNRDELDRISDLDE